MADRPLTAEDRRNFSACQTLVRALEMLAGAEVMADRVANYRTLMMAAGIISESTPRDDAMVRRLLARDRMEEQAL